MKILESFLHCLDTKYKLSVILDMPGHINDSRTTAVARKQYVVAVKAFSDAANLVFSQNFRGEERDFLTFSESN